MDAPLYETPAEYWEAEAAMKAAALTEAEGETRPHTAETCPDCKGVAIYRDIPSITSYSRQATMTRCMFCDGRGWIVPLSQPERTANV